MRSDPMGGMDTDTIRAITIDQHGSIIVETESMLQLSHTVVHRIKAAPTR